MDSPKEESPSLNVNKTESSDLSKGKESKNRRTRAGFEVYQVKKRHSVTVDLSEKPNSPIKSHRNSQSEPRQSKKNQQNSTKNYRSKSNSSYAQHGGHSHQQKQHGGHSQQQKQHGGHSQQQKHGGHQQKQHGGYKNQEHQQINKSPFHNDEPKIGTNTHPVSLSSNSEDWDLELNEDIKPLNSGTEIICEKIQVQPQPNLSTQGHLTTSTRRIMSESDLKKKTSGQSLLECPCTYLPSTEEMACASCALEKKPDLTAGSTHSLENKSKETTISAEREVTPDGNFDIEFLVKASSIVRKPSFENAIHDILETSKDGKQKDDGVEHNSMKFIPVSEINALFSNVKVNHHDDEKICSPKTTMESIETNQQSVGKSYGPDILQKSRQRNFMSSIVSILNENKHHDKAQKVTTEKTIPRKYSAGQNSTKKERIQKKENLSNSQQKLEQKTTTNKKQVNGKLSKERKLNSPKKQQSCETNRRYRSVENVLKDGGTIEKQVHFHDAEVKEKVPEDYVLCIKKHQNILRKHLQNGFESIDAVKNMINSSDIVQQKYADLIVYKQDDAFRNDYESLLWKTGFHSIILQFRKFLDDDTISTKVMQDIGTMYWHFLQNGIQFLDSLLLQLQEHHDICLDNYLNDPIQMIGCTKQIRLSLRSCHLLLIYIGDLERYISQLQQEDTYKKAQDCYKQAQILAPKNGKSYNQLAVVAVYTKRKLDAVYYYGRSLQASNPILTAKDRLTAIFNEIKKKAGIYQLKHCVVANSSPALSQPPNNHRTSNNQYQNADMRRNDHLKDEVWIFYRNNHMFKIMLTNQNEIIDLTPSVNQIKLQDADTSNVNIKEDKKVSLRNVNRGFIIQFLYIHCKLYTNIGLEEFTSLHQETLSDFTTLLRYPKTSSMKEDNLLKYTAINIFTIHNLLEKKGYDKVIPNTAIDLAIVFGMDMFHVMCKCCVDAEDLYTCKSYLPAIRIWLRWMVTNASLILKSTASSMFDIWSSSCNLFNKISFLPVDVDIVLNEDENENVYLYEDLFLAGFKPLSPSLKFCKPNHNDDVDKAMFQFRINDMLDLIVQLNQYGSLPFVYDEKDKLYKSIQSSVTSISPVKTPKVVEIEDEVDSCDDATLEEEDFDDDDEKVYVNFGDMTQISELKLQKAALEKQLENDERKRQAAISVIESHKLEGRHIFENSPTYLVADTNCYIDHLNYILIVIESKIFTLVVPLIVINELDGLKKGSYYDPTKFHHDRQIQVQEKARLAVDLLEDRFSQQDSNIRAITSSGNEMDTIVFRSEEFSQDRGTNDDVILSCCLKYCTEHISRAEGDASIVRRDVVLLTNDRNLRLKAHSRYVPTVNLTTFMNMAKLL